MENGGNIQLANDSQGMCVGVTHSTFEISIDYN